MSLRSAQDQKLNHCVFFSRRLSLAERKYDIGNRELPPFLVWTGHKILEYIRSAKRLNSRQAWWPLFFTRFNFSLSYQPGSHKIKPDTLSCQFMVGVENISNLDIILPAPRLIAILTWEVEERVKAALEDQPGPSSCPQDRLFVPQDLRSDVLQWAYGSPLTCHPGIQRT